MCTAVPYSLDETPQPRNPPTLPVPPHLGFYMRTPLVSQDRRHLIVTPWSVSSASYAVPVPFYSGEYLKMLDPDPDWQDPDKNVDRISGADRIRMHICDSVFSIDRFFHEKPG